jgi:hypothetical protein
LPRFTVTRYVEHRYEVDIEAATEKDAIAMADSMDLAAFGEPNNVVSDEVYLYDDEGDEI